MGDRRDTILREQADVSGRRTKPDTTQRKPPRDETGAGFWGIVERTTGLAVGDTTKRSKDRS